MNWDAARAKQREDASHRAQTDLAGAPFPHGHHRCLYFYPFFPTGRPISCFCVQRERIEEMGLETQTVLLMDGIQTKTPNLSSLGH